MMDEYHNVKVGDWFFHQAPSDHLYNRFAVCEKTATGWTTVAMAVTCSPKDEQNMHLIVELHNRKDWQQHVHGRRCPGCGENFTQSEWYLVSRFTMMGATHEGVSIRKVTADEIAEALGRGLMVNPDLRHSKECALKEVERAV